MPYQNKCIVCDKLFPSRTYWKKYCSSQCVQAMWALRKFDLKCLKRELKNKQKKCCQN